MDKMLDKYAQLVVCTGVNLQTGQELIINSPIECADFARRVARAGFAAGARDVAIKWSDEKMARIRLDNAELEVFGEFPKWRHDMFMEYIEKGAAVISIHASDPEIFSGADSEKLLLNQRTAGKALLEYRQKLMSNELRWCVVSIPTSSWAAKVFPEVSKEQAVELLWKAIFKTVRIEADNQPVDEWKRHTEYLKRASDFMNSSRFKALEYSNSLGTRLTVKLPEGHIWAGGAELAADGVSFVANMPTEEIYTLPDRDGADGVVYAAKPLVYHGQVIEDMVLTFEKGKVIEAKASRGQEALDELLATDEGACHLGEVALVPYDSPISNTGVLFYNTLFDENAACHLAFGKAYPTCIENGDQLDSVELVKRGVNDSLVHEDFMIGTSDMCIIGIKADGTRVQVFENGNFVKF